MVQPTNSPACSISSPESFESIPRVFRQLMPRRPSSAIKYTFSLSHREASPAAGKKKVPANAISHPCLGHQGKGVTGRSRSAPMPSGAHPPLPTSKPNLVASCSERCKLHAATHAASITTFNKELPKACRSRMRINIACNHVAYHRCHTDDTAVHNATELLLPIRSGPLAKDRNSLACPTNICRYPGAKLHLHESWACGTIDPPIRNPLPCLCTRTLRYVEYPNPGSSENK